MYTPIYIFLNKLSINITSCICNLCEYKHYIKRDHECAAYVFWSFCRNFRGLENSVYSVRFLFYFNYKIVHISIVIIQLYYYTMHVMHTISNICYVYIVNNIYI